MPPNSSCGYVNIRPVVIDCDTHMHNQNQVEYNKNFSLAHNMFAVARDTFALIGFLSVANYLFFNDRDLFDPYSAYTAYGRPSDNYKDLLLECLNVCAYECAKFCLRSICGQIGVDDDHLIEGPSSDLTETSLTPLGDQRREI